MIFSCLELPHWQLEESAVLVQNRDPLHWWNKFSANVIMSSDINTSLAEELQSSYIWQSGAFN
jgi:hypothetical protein